MARSKVKRYARYAVGALALIALVLIPRGRDSDCAEGDTVTFTKQTTVNAGWSGFVPIPAGTWPVMEDRYQFADGNWWVVLQVCGKQLSILQDDLPSDCEGPA